jgi:ABC-2 type transport system permease protein
MKQLGLGIRWHRIRASILHSWYHLSHSVETWVDLIWFSVIDILVFGFMALYFAGEANVGQYLIAGIILWEVVRISQYTVTVGVLWEIWSKSFSTLFISPLSMFEFVIGQAISGFLKSVGVATMVALIAWLAFGFAVWQLGWILILYFLILFTFAVATGMFILGLIMRFGTNIQSLAWGLIFIFQPLSAIFYPLSVLPDYLQPVALLSPITYIMESTRHQLSVGQPLWGMVGQSMVLAYLVLCSLFLRGMIAWSRKTGAFARMDS